MLDDLFGTRQGQFLMFTIVVVLIILIIAPDMRSALIPLTLISNVLIISTQTRYIEKQFDDDLASDSVADSEHHAILGGQPPSPIVTAAFTNSPPKVAEGFSSRDLYEDYAYGGYPGGLNPYGPDPLDGRVNDYSAAGLAPGQGPTYAPVNVARGSDAPRPPLLNPYQLNRVESRAEPWGSPPGSAPSNCQDIGDSVYAEARDTFDGDRKVVEYAKWRHDPYRQAAGRLRGREIMDKYFREEVDEEEDRPWWGRYDN